MRSVLALATLLAFTQLSYSAVLAPYPQHHQLSTGQESHRHQGEQSLPQKYDLKRLPHAKTTNAAVSAVHHVAHQQPTRLGGNKLRDTAQELHLNKRSSSEEEELSEDLDDDVNLDSSDGLTKRAVTWHHCASIEGLGIAACTRRHPPRHYPRVIGDNATSDAIDILLNMTVAQYGRPEVNDPFYCIETPAPADVSTELRKSYKLCIGWNEDKKFNGLMAKGYSKIKEYMFNQCITESGEFMSSLFRLRLDDSPNYAEICFSNQGEKGCHRDLYMCDAITKKDWQRKYKGAATEQMLGIPNSHIDYIVGDEELDNVWETTMAEGKPMQHFGPS